MEGQRNRCRQVGVLNLCVIWVICGALFVSFYAKGRGAE